MKIVAVIPVKHNSDRVKSKNFVKFYNNDSLLSLKIKQLKNSGVFDKIYISSDSIIAKKLALKFDVDFIPRDSEFCNNDISWSEVIYKVIDSIPVDQNTSIAWCHTTSPFFDNYKDAVSTYKKVLSKKFDGLITVSKCKEFLINEYRQPVNYQWGVWHKYSQMLPNFYYITGALFISKKNEMLKNQYVISKNPFLYETNKLESIDIDDNFDFLNAKSLIKIKKNLYE